jgi:1-acyl-sn-glycerol-3-phosphate acyltransferase
VTAVRSAVFIVFIWLWTLALSLLYLPLLLLPRGLTARGARLWSRGVLWGMRWICGLRWTVRGREHLLDGPVLVAAKHQSAFETFVMALIFNDPAFVLKRELLWIPFFGWYLNKSGVIAIDRSAGTRALRAMMKGAENAVAAGRPVVIFPEGTRAAPGAKLPYHSGVAMLYGTLGCPVVPIALNSGVFWRRRGFRKRPGTIVIEILPSIAPGLERKRFMAELENRIETASSRLVVEGQQSLAKDDAVLTVS